MRICLVNPPISRRQRYGGLSSIGSRLPPVNLALLAAVARRAGHDVTLLDAERFGWDISETASRVLAVCPDLVGLTAVTLSVTAAAMVADCLKRSPASVTVCIGGVHVTSNAEETLQRFPSIDVGVLGEGEKTLLELAGALGKGTSLDRVDGLMFRRGQELVRTAPRQPLTPEEMEGLPWPAWDLLPDFTRAYRPALHSFRRLPCVSLVTSRGCVGRCTFCDRTVSGSRVRGFSAEYLYTMIRDLVYRYKVREVMFHDDNFVMLRNRLRSFCELLIRDGPSITWSCNARVDMINLELLHLMKRAGCWQIGYGIESGSQEILDSLGKGITLEQVRQTLVWTREAGIESRGYWMIGVPGETRDTLRKTRELLMELPLNDFSMSMFAPHPGSQITRELLDQGKIAPDWERDSGFMVTYVPEGLSADELVTTQRRSILGFYLRPRIILNYAKRMASSPAAWLPLCKAVWQVARHRAA